MENGLSKSGRKDGARIFSLATAKGQTKHVEMGGKGKGECGFGKGDSLPHLFHSLLRAPSVMPNPWELLCVGWRKQITAKAGWPHYQISLKLFTQKVAGSPFLHLLPFPHKNGQAFRTISFPPFHFVDVPANVFSSISIHSFIPPSSKTLNFGSKMRCGICPQASINAHTISAIIFIKELFLTRATRGKGF